MRPPLDPNETYTIMSATQARKVLQRDHRIARSDTADYSLDQLHDEMAKHLAPEVGALIVVITDKSFSKLNEELNKVLSRITGGDFIEGAALLSRAGALRRLGDAGVEVPPDAKNIELEDALAGLDGQRPNVIADEEFAVYGLEAHRLLATMPSGRAKQQTGQTVH